MLTDCSQNRLQTRMFAWWKLPSAAVWRPSPCRGGAEDTQAGVSEHLGDTASAPWPALLAFTAADHRDTETQRHRDTEHSLDFWARIRIANDMDVG